MIQKGVTDNKQMGETGVLTVAHCAIRSQREISPVYLLYPETDTTSGILETSGECSFSSQLYLVGELELM